MNLSPGLKGLSASVAAAVALTFMYLISKSVLNDVHITQFGFYWYGIAIVLISVYIIITGRIKALLALDTSVLAVLGTISFVELIATVSFFYSIHLMENPAIVAFIGNTNPVFVMIMGFFFLRERFTLMEFLGMGFIVVGMSLISISGIGSFQGFFRQGTGWAVIAAFFFALGGIIAKHKIKVLDPVIITLSRSLVLFVFSAVTLFITGHSLLIPAATYSKIAVGAFVGPFLSALFVYTALKYIEATRAAMIISSRSILILIGAWLLWENLPAPAQLIGGFIILAGVFLLSAGKLRKSRG
ncbi:MAG: DMT family transporter [Bacteroidetes bacterium]|nr:DMT family transporter [Bacteroidota bacterium]